VSEQRAGAAVTRGFSGLLTLSDEVEQALIRGHPVVALETSLVAHGLPSPHGVETARVCEERVRAAGAVPATVAVVDGSVRVGIDAIELERLGSGEEPVRKVSPRDLAPAVIGGELGATTVGGTLAVCRIAGIHFMSTGGIGGVHRGWAGSMDISADLAEIGLAAVCVVCSGAKSLLDIPATLEVLESIGVPVIGYGCDSFPLFYHRESLHTLPDRADDPLTVAAVAATHWGFARTTGVVVAQPVAEEVALQPDDVEPLIAEALADAQEAGINGHDLTPFVLARINEATDGRTLAANRRLVEDNAGLAAEVAVAYYSD
jgi:pseudouridine-5'-phosphate glycosidase